MGLNLGNFGGMNSGKALTSILGGLKGGLPGKSSFNVSSLATMLNTITSPGGMDSTVNYTYKYKVATYQLIIPSKKEPINILKSAIEKIIITKNYDQCIHPILEIVTTLPPKLHDEIKKNKQEAKIRLKIQKCQYNSADGSMARAKSWIDGTFSLIMDDESDFKEKDAYEEANKAMKAPSDAVFNPADYSTEYTLSLWNMDHINAMRKPVNDIFKDCTISSAISNLYSKATGIKKILISPLDNTKKYSEVRIKPMNLMNVPAYLDKIYGTYYSGSSVFLDFRCLYFLSKNGVCDAKEKGEYTRTIFRVPKSTSSARQKVGTTIDDKNKFFYMYLTTENIDFTSPSNTKDALEGNNVSFVDPKNNETTNVEGAGEQNGSGNSRIMEDNYNNEFNKSTVLSEVVESSKVATITLYDYDDDAMTPNKEFVITFDDSELSNRNGFYRLLESNIILNRGQSELEITGMHKLAFKAPASSGDTGNKGKAETMQNMSPSAINSPANQTAIANATGKPVSGLNTNSTSQAFVPQAPQPRTTKLNESTINVSGSTQNSVTKNKNYSYDSLGNLKGVDIPEYNRVKESDSIAVRNAKIAKQQKTLPSQAPQPKLKSNI